MGNQASRGRNRPQQEQPPQTFAYPPPQQVQGPPQAQQEPVLYGPQSINNGQMYGGWRPPYQQQNSVPPQMPQAAQAPQQPQELTQTATIRNAVNLKKNTLKLVPLSDSPGKFSIHFVFDASTPCRLTCFVVGQEEPAEGCRINGMKYPPALPGFYGKGLGHIYPKPGAPLSEQVVIDLSQNPEELAAAKGDEYPLIFRLETISEKGLADGHVLEELEVGQKQQVWVQSQTTFACVAKNEEGQHMCKVLKQKIWVEGISYELQEIYGMEHASDGRVKTQHEHEEDMEERLCVICLNKDRDTTVLPCRHMCMCHECAQELRKQTSKCPICRNHVESLLHIKMQQKPSNKQVAAAVAASGGDAAKLTDEFQKLQVQQEKAVGGTSGANNV
ncbi:MAG: hypothetical protein FRX49_03614 [Trebouxia sp. A1-2]|nr:MAG: hypothetical protein FRX49_03614 [Trebouxia sp. A1-2]